MSEAATAIVMTRWITRVLGCLMLLTLCPKEALVSNVMPPRSLVVLAEIETVNVPKKVVDEDRVKWGGASWHFISRSETAVIVRVRPLEILKYEMGPSPYDPPTYERALFVQVPEFVARKGSRIRVRVNETSETKLDKTGKVSMIHQTGASVTTEYLGPASDVEHDNHTDRKSQKAALYSAFQKEDSHFPDDPLTFTFWLHGGEPATGSDALDVMFGSGTYRARYIRERFQGGAKPFKVDRFEGMITYAQADELLRMVFKSRLFEAVYPSETQPPIADILKETWELKGRAADLQVTFFQKFPDDLAPLRAACTKLMSELEEQSKGDSKSRKH